MTKFGFPRYTYEKTFWPRAGQQSGRSRAVMRDSVSCWLSGVLAGGKGAVGHAV
jgi:hypothetical protein